MFAALGLALRRCARACPGMARRFLASLKTAMGTLVGGALGDLARTKAELVAGRPADQQPIVLRRQEEQADRLLRSRGQGFRLFWRAKSAAAMKRPQVPDGTVALIKHMAVENRLWGAERIRCEVLKLGIRVSKRTVRRHMRVARPPRPMGQHQAWATFARNHANTIRACDFLRNTARRHSYRRAA